MSFNVRLFAYPGMQELAKVNSKQFSSDSVYVLVQPYKWAQLLVADTVAVSSAAVAEGVSGPVEILRVEVPDGAAIRYEINPPSRSGGAVTANTNSPILSGHDQFYFRPGWSISIIDAAALP